MRVSGYEVRCVAGTRQCDQVIVVGICGESGFDYWIWFENGSGGRVRDKPVGLLY